MNIDALRDQTIDQIIKVEGGYSTHPADSGGETMYGITAKVARAHGYTGPMANLPRTVAEDIYRQQFWDSLRLTDIARASLAVAAEVADTAVNCGTGTAARFVQTALNAFNLNATLYPDLTVDGAIGPKTVQALEAYLRHRGDEGETVLLRALNSLQGAYYIDLSQRRAKDEAFVYGWLLHRVHI
jgi:lysozyme family protein